MHGLTARAAHGLELKMRPINGEKPRDRANGKDDGNNPTRGHPALLFGAPADMFCGFGDPVPDLMARSPMFYDTSIALM
jgi:hypothetical protein